MSRSVGGWPVVAVAVAVACVGCAGTQAPTKLAEAVSVNRSDVRMGLAAEDGLPGDPILEGEGFEQLTDRSYVCLVEGGGLSGTLTDGDGAVARGVAEDSLALQGFVYAKPGLDGGRSAAQVVQLSNTDLNATAKADGVRVEIDTEVEVALSGSAVAICEVEGEATLDSHAMGKVTSAYHFYPEGDRILVYRGPRRAAASPVANFANGGQHRLHDPTFYFGIGPGIYKLHYTLKLSVACPAGDPDSVASLKASSTAALR